MGLRAEVLKHKGQSYANGGLSDTLDYVTLVNVEGPFDPTPDAPAAVLVAGNVAGTAKVVPAVEVTGPGAAVEYHGKYGPLLADGEKTIGPMMGGSYVCTSDSRFNNAIEALLGKRFYGAVPLHDRYETPAQYDMLSR
jgi:hypothetical protein